MSGRGGQARAGMSRVGTLALAVAWTLALPVAMTSIVVMPAWSQAAPKLRTGAFHLSDEDRAYWAFQPVQRPAVPAGRGAAHPVDAFLRETLQRHGLDLSGPATPREQVRRVYFDLLGLPPAPEDVAAFERDPSDAAWAALVARLLASPQYGERWGRHWLDLVRFAESNGYERDGAKPDAWRYRDYVIDAFNRDKPYDQFVREQLAGDELADDAMARPGAAGSGSGSAEWRAAIIATGFYRLHVWDDEPDSTVKAEFDDLDDMLVTTGTAFLGLTIGCARCHDHKYDPVSQTDYYAMLGFLRSIDPYGQHHTGGGGRGTGRIQRVLASDDELARWEEAKRERVKAAEARLAQAVAATPVDAELKKRLEGELKRERDAAPPFDRALAVAENGPQPKPTMLLSRGDAFSPRGEVAPAFPAVFGAASPVFPARDAKARTTGRRSVLAQWVASAGHPLTARVMANRIWQRHFGVGLVPTPDDFGRTGLPPTHPALLDYLASEFVAGGWSVKRLHTLILNSRAYRMSSRHDARRARTVDEANTYYWRQNLRRAEAEVVRDTMLAVSGTLNPKRGGPSVYPTLAREVHGTQDSAGKGWADSPPDEQNRRSVYLVVKRALKVPLLECLDFANSASGTGTRPVTTTAPQALMLLNDAFVQGQAAAFADRLAREHPVAAAPSSGAPSAAVSGSAFSTPVTGAVETARLERAFALALQRPPTRAELKAARALLADQRARARAEVAGGSAGSNPEDVAWRSVCRALLNLNELIYID